MAADRRIATAPRALAPQLDLGEEVVTAGEAVSIAQRRSGRGAVVLTDRRLLWVERGLHDGRMVELPLSAITAVEHLVGPARGDAKRGDLTISARGGKTHLARIRPWQCSERIASYIRGRITEAAR